MNASGSVCVQILSCGMAKGVLCFLAAGETTHHPSLSRIHECISLLSVVESRKGPLVLISVLSFHRQTAHDGSKHQSASTLKRVMHTWFFRDTHTYIHTYIHTCTRISHITARKKWSLHVRHGGVQLNDRWMSAGPHTTHTKTDAIRCNHCSQHRLVTHSLLTG